MIHRLNTLTRRLAVAAAFIALGLAASAPAAQAQCSPKDCRTAETVAVDLTPMTPAPVVALASVPMASAQSACDAYPNCLNAHGALATVSSATPNAAPVLAPGVKPEPAMCDTPADCLSGLNAGDR